MEFLPFEEARKYVHKRNLRNQKEWRHIVSQVRNGLIYYHGRQGFIKINGIDGKIGWVMKKLYG